MAVKIAVAPQYVVPYLQRLNPNEVHNAGGDCINPKCDYHFTNQDKTDIAQFDGAFTCPKCDWSYNYYYDNDRNSPGGYTRSGLTMTQMGSIGENIIGNMRNIPGVGPVVWMSPDYNSPLDAIIGHYGCEIKTNHSEATPRFKLGGAAERQEKILQAQEMGLIPALVGVRLNFYTDKADIFFRQGFTDTWIGNAQMQHVAKVDFGWLNPYKSPEQVPPANLLPDDDSTPGPDDDIPF